MEDESPLGEQTIAGKHVETHVVASGEKPSDPAEPIQPSNVTHPHGQAQQQNDPTGSMMDMSGMANTLPSYEYQGASHVYPHHNQHPTSTHIMYQYPPANFPGGLPNYPAQFAQQMTMQYHGQRIHGSYPLNTNTTQQSFQGHVYLPNQMMIPIPNQPHFPHFHPGTMVPQMNVSNVARGGHGQPQYKDFNRPTRSMGEEQEFSIVNSMPSIQTRAALRGPPRKPKQSGHALWVGNLPPGANIIDLKDHFARDATEDIESVFLISKSNCAFVNYKNEQSCTAAMSRFHDSRFQGVRLVCRLRRGSIANNTTSSPAVAAAAGTTAAVPQSPLHDTDSEDSLPSAEVSKEEQSIEKDIIKIPERFFVIKSLTIEDLERSAQTGIWATQSHNEAALNKAYQTAENVYLIFSANKSGEYFGYARMDSTIDDESAAKIASEQPDIEPVAAPELTSPVVSNVPLTITTPATATAPPGHIIDDSARGTIFWESESAVFSEDSKEVDSEQQSASDVPQSPLSDSHSVNESPSQTHTTFGKPFKITWQSTDRLPFYRTRGLRNPWNANREVKIARDGTEIEPSIGRKLVNMFGTQGTMQQRPPVMYNGPFIVGQSLGQPPSGPSYGRGY